MHLFSKLSSPGKCIFRLNHSKAQLCLKDILSGEISKIKEAGTWKSERIISSKQDVSITVEGQNNEILNFCANNYLGLSSNSDVVAFTKETVEKYGAGLSSVRFICGTQTIHKELECKIAEFHKRESAIVYASCFDANAGIFEVLLGPDDGVFSDELNHASIIDGIRLCKAKKFRYKHRNMDDLEAQLKAGSDCRIKLIVTDGVFSMDGNVAPLPEIFKIAEKHNALTFVDECHATGFFGKTGRGTEEYFNMNGKIDIINSTLGKAMGGASGGYTTGPCELVELLRQRSRPYLFSNSLPPAVVGTALKVLDMLMTRNVYAETVAENTNRFREGMSKAGFKIAGDNHPICPVMLGDAKLAANFAEQMLERCIYVVGFSFPVVPKDKARIRVQISAAHSAQDIDRAINAFVEVGKQLGVVK